MNVLISGVLLFVSALLLHLVIWRLRHPGNPVRSLILLFAAVFFLGVILLSLRRPYTAGQYIYIAFFYFSLFAGYLITYSAIEADSPSLVIVSRIAGSGKQGLPREDIEERSWDDLLIIPRLKDLMEAGLVELEGLTYKITGKGRLFLSPFMLYRKFLGLGKGG